VLFKEPVLAQAREQLIQLRHELLVGDGLVRQILEDHPDHWLEEPVPQVERLRQFSLDRCAVVVVGRYK